MTLRDWTHEFQMLLKGYPRYLQGAKAYVSPNPEDDLYVKMALAGFSLTRPTVEWGINHFDFIQEHRRGDYSDQQLADRGPRASTYALFACTALGYLLGLYQGDLLDDAEFSRAEALLAGFLAMNEEEILSLPA
jgi:hypothetical protein